MITQNYILLNSHPHPVNICKCMHLHIFRDEFSRLNRENFHCNAINCKAMKSLVKIYANACIYIYFKRAAICGDIASEPCSGARSQILLTQNYNISNCCEESIAIFDCKRYPHKHLVIDMHFLLCKSKKRCINNFQMP